VLPVEELRQAAVTMRRRAQLANTEQARRPYGDRNVDPVPAGEWGALVENYLGGTVGMHCASWTPAVAAAVADLLELAVDRWDANGHVMTGAAALAVARAYLGDPATATDGARS
jgi:hypothetical protein